MRRRLGAGLTAVGLLMGIFGVYAPQAGASHPGTSGGGITPTYVAGNPMCPDDSELWRIDGVPEEDETESGNFEGSDWTITITEASNTSFDWEVDGISIGTVIVKAGNGGFVYTYDPGEDEGDTNLQSPHSKGNDPSQPQAAISHVSFCVGSEAPSSGTLRVEKTVDNEVDDDFDASNLEFEFDVECTLDDDTFTIDDQIVTPTTAWESGAIATGYECTVTEDTSKMPDADGASWGTPTYTGNPATIGDDDTVTVVIENVREEEEDRTVIITEDTTTTTTSTTSTTTTTVPEEVLGEEVTTTTAAPVEETTTTEATVAGIQLPRTGAETGTLLVLAGVALALGGLLIGASDRAARRLGRERA